MSWYGTKMVDCVEIEMTLRTILGILSQISSIIPTMGIFNKNKVMNGNFGVSE